MKPCVFVQNNLVERLTVPAARAARSLGAALEDRSSTSDFDPDACGVDWAQYDPVVPIGSVQFVRKLKGSRSLARYTWYDSDSFSARSWNSRLGSRMLNQSGYPVLARDVPRTLRATPLHARPDCEDKAFRAHVFTSQQWGLEAQARRLRADLDCWVSPVREIRAEWRCWFVGGKFVAASQYRETDQMAVVADAPAAVEAYARQVADLWLPAPCVVMDVAAVAEGFRVVEFNPIHSSGWYAVDVAAVLQAWLNWSCKLRQDI